MENPSTKPDTMFKKTLVVTAVAMVIFILVAVVLFLFRGPDIRANLVELISAEQAAIEYNQGTIKLGLTGESLQFATTANSLLASLTVEQLATSDQFGRQIAGDEVESTLDQSLIDLAEQAKNSNRLNEHYDENVLQILSSIEAGLADIIELEDNQLLRQHLEQIQSLKASI